MINVDFDDLGFWLFLCCLVIAAAFGDCGGCHCDDDCPPCAEAAP